MSIWDKQDYETKRQFLYFQKFLDSNTRNFTQFYKNYVSKLEKDSTSKSPPTYKTFQKWATSNKWAERYEAFDKKTLVDANITIQQIAAKNMVQDYLEYDKLERKVRQLSLDTANSLTLLDSKTAYTLSETSKAMKTYQEGKRLISGESTDNSQVTADIKAEVETKDILSEIAELESVLDNSEGGINED